MSQEPPYQGPEGGAYPPPPPQYPQGPGGPPSGGPPQQQAKGALGALFDFGFSSFVTPALVKVIYIVSIVLVAIYYVFLVITGFATGEPVLGMLALLLGWIPALLVIAFIRVTLEFYYALIRMSEDVHHRRPGAGM